MSDPRIINVSVEDKDGRVFYRSEEGTWRDDQVWVVDWKDSSGMLEAGVEAGRLDGEVVLLQDGSDCYIIASMADVN